MLKLKELFIVLILFTSGCATYPAEHVVTQSVAPQLDEKIRSLIYDAAYEVVVPKPDKDSLSYEKPLPLDLIPYSIRTDKYYSVGTAFAIGPNQFVSAAHVMNIDYDSQIKDVFLRDKDGKILGIDKILKYSDHRDFAVFSIKNKIAKHFFEINPSHNLNSKVYAVGNALGQGIVVRDGLHTSNTTEDEAGEWKWIRFSAAASPGNSGGPLLDQDGKVIGIILRKSENENLNYALPISEVMNAKPNKAVVHLKMKYFIDNMDMTKAGTLEKEFQLPKSYQELKREVVKSINSFSDGLLKDLFKENRENIFPRGKGTAMLLNSTIGTVFPDLIMKGEDGNWDAFYPKETSKSQLENNGYMTYGKLGNSLFLYLHKPDNISSEKFMTDSKLFMDLILKGIYSSREIGSEKIKITSLGKAREEYTHSDSYGRKWIVRSWLMEYDDSKVVTFSLPVPGGCITMMREGQTGLVDGGHVPDLKALTDFIYVSYYGTLKEWNDFLKMKDMLPAAFSNIKISFDYNKRFDFSSQRLSFSYSPAVMGLTEKSSMQLFFTYFEDKGKVVWDIGSIWVGEDKNKDTGFTLARNARPPKSLSDNYQSKWEKILKQNFPYNASAYFEDKTTSISTVYDKDIEDAKRMDILYTLTYWRDGKVEQQEMKAKIDQFMQTLTVSELIDGKTAAPQTKIGKK